VTTVTKQSREPKQIAIVNEKRRRRRKKKTNGDGDDDA
jgi:hypothetical protein